MTARNRPTWSKLMTVKGFGAGLMVVGVLGLLVLLKTTPATAHSAEKLPYTNGECRHITNGYGDGLHTGSDYYAVDWNLPGSADDGKPVRNVSWGTAYFVAWDGAYGKTVKVDYGSGLTARYSHLKSYSVNSGAYVARGWTLGAVGNTGSGAGGTYHLHFTEYLNGAAHKPEPIDGYTNLGHNTGCIYWSTNVPEPPTDRKTNNAPCNFT